MGEKMFPVQKDRGYGKPHPLLIPWSVAELAFSQYHYSQTLECIAERGGFGPGEMDEYCPDWIERCDRITSLRGRVEELEATIRMIRKPVQLYPVYEQTTEWCDGCKTFTRRGTWCKCDDMGDTVDPAVWPRIIEKLDTLPKVEASDPDDTDPFV